MKTFLKSEKLLALAAIIVVMAAMTNVLITRTGAQSAEAAPAGFEARIGGSWAFTISQTDGEVYPFHITFSQDGGFVASCDSPFLGPLHGNWAATGGHHQIALTFVGQAFDPSGAEDPGSFKGRLNLTLGGDGSLAGQMQFLGFDSAGNAIPELAASGTITGAKIPIEALDE